MCEVRMQCDRIWENGWVTLSFTYVSPTTIVDQKCFIESAWLPWQPDHSNVFVIVSQSSLSYYGMHNLCIPITIFIVCLHICKSLVELPQKDTHKEPVRKLSKQEPGPKHAVPPAKHILATTEPGSSEEDSEAKDSFPDMWGPPPAATARVSISQVPPSTALPEGQRKLSKHDSRTEANFLIDEHFAGLADPEVDVANWPLFTEVSSTYVYVYTQCMHILQARMLSVLCSG